MLGVRDAYQLRSFLMNALRHALAESHSEMSKVRAKVGATTAAPMVNSAHSY